MLNSLTVILITQTGSEKGQDMFFD